MFLLRNKRRNDTRRGRDIRFLWSAQTSDLPRDFSGAFCNQAYIGTSSGRGERKAKKEEAERTQDAAIFDKTDRSVGRVTVATCTVLLSPGRDETREQSPKQRGNTISRQKINFTTHRLRPRKNSGDVNSATVYRTLKASNSRIKSARSCTSPIRTCAL